jgi:galactose mutarotase-like enzyme
MPIHGILTLTEWNQIECDETPESVRVVYKLMVPEIVRELSFPFDLAMTQTYEIEPGAINMTTNITNQGDKPAPFAFGYHPYFALPDAKRQDVTLSLPSSTRLSLEPKLLVPTGETEQTPSEFQLEPGLDYDCVYSNLTGTRATLSVGQLRRQVHIDFEKDIENLVIYAGSKTSAVCVEPWTKGFAAYSKLSKEDWEEFDVISVIKPSEERVLRVKYSVEDS